MKYNLLTMQSHSNDFDHFIERRSSDSIKWRRYDPDVLPLWIADMDFRCPEVVLQALKSRVEHGVFGYPMEADPDLISLVVQRMWSRYQWKISPEDVFLVPGVVSAINLCCQAIGKPGEGVVVQTPVYPPILNCPQLAEMVRQGNELIVHGCGRYVVDYDAFEKCITPKTRLFILCNPHNPVGRVFQRDELEKMANVCLEKDIVICSDEIHSDLVFRNHVHIPIASLDDEIAQRCITMIAPSKTFNIPGLECSCMIVQNKELRERIKAGRRGMIGWVNSLGQVAAKAAYQYGQPWLEELLVYLEGNRDFLARYLQETLPQIRMHPPDGTYLAWLDFRSAGMEKDPYEVLLETGRVALQRGEEFGPGGEGFLRMNFGCPRNSLMEALERIRVAIQS